MKYFASDESALLPSYESSEWCMLTREIIELIQCLHDNCNQGQVELGNVSPDLRVLVARICIMAAQQGVHSTNGFFVEEENAVG